MSQMPVRTKPSDIFFASLRPGVFAVALAIQYYGRDETADFPMD
jgi:hypothetical protein